MSTPLFSIVIPTYNRSNLLRCAIQSVLRQTFPDFEILVSDNVSQDDTREVVAQFGDPRVKYLRPEQHLVIADNWEFGRSRATGKLILMLADDDALVPNALELFAGEHHRHDADFLFSSLAEYRDRTFMGPQFNSVTCPAFSGRSRVIDPSEFLGPLFAFRPLFNCHPSAYVFEKRLAGSIASRCGRFFQTNGVEFFAWPLAAAFARKIVHLDLPLTILGRTSKSWGSNLVLCNPGNKRIKEFTSDASQERIAAPLSNFTMCNLMAEGMLTAKKLFPRELEQYQFDEISYLKQTFFELRRRQNLGVDVSQEMAELLDYLTGFPSLKEELLALRNGAGALSWKRRIRHFLGKAGLDWLQRRQAAREEVERVRRGDVDKGFRISGSDFGFQDALGCAEFLAQIGATALQPPRSQCA